jgi:hypothetical protein
MSKIYQGLLEERSQLVAEGKAIFDLAEKETRELSEDEKRRDDEINARLANVNTEIQRHEAARERERTVKAVSQITGIRDRAEDDPKRGFADIGEFAMSVKAMYTPGEQLTNG